MEGIGNINGIAVKFLREIDFWSKINNEANSGNVQASYTIGNKTIEVSVKSKRD